MNRYRELLGATRARALDIFGVTSVLPDDPAPSDCRTILLLGPREAGFWNVFSASPEYRDGRAHPLDRWSKRVIGELAGELGAHAILPSDGPPCPPFFQWALRSGRAWQSPVMLLVHDRAGLMVSYRGALALSDGIAGPHTGPHAPPKPCGQCHEPCLTACPANALAQGGYDPDGCHGYLDTMPGKDCLSRGCAVRRACPVSQNHGRPEEQSAFHMRAFHPE